jgi:surface polysaccharide O-acyltransferase-like enzyme
MSSGIVSDATRDRADADPVSAVAVAPAPRIEAAPAVARTPGRSSTPRLANVERLRLVAMFDIVAFHVSEHRLPIIAGLGLPSFLLLNNAFNTTLSERMGTRGFLRTKVTKLLVPWIVWSLFYALLLLLEKLRHHESIAATFTPWMIIGGTYVHLWFVPFALAGGVFAALLQARTRDVPERPMSWLMLGVGAVATLLGAFVIETRVVHWPALQWLFALPSPLLGFALGRVILSGDRRLLAAIAAVCSVAAAACEVASQLSDVPQMVTRYVVSVALVSLALLWPGRMDPVSQRLTPLLFGVYLTHPLIVRAYKALHWPDPGVAPLTALIFCASLALVAALRRTPLRRLV